MKNRFEIHCNDDPVEIIEIISDALRPFGLEIIWRKECENKEYDLWEIRESEVRFGEFFAPIPQEKVPYNWQKLEDFDMLFNKHKQKLLYYKSKQYYRFLTDDGNEFISLRQMFSKWKRL